MSTPGSPGSESVEEGLRARRRHLALVSELERRMSLASLLVRGWSALLVAALLAVAAHAEYARFAWLALFMALTFWLLDAYTLRQRRLFAKVRARVASGALDGPEFSLDTSAVDSAADAWGAVLCARAPGIFHGAVLCVIALSRLLFSLRGAF